MLLQHHCYSGHIGNPNFKYAIHFFLLLILLQSTFYKVYFYKICKLCRDLHTSPSCSTSSAGSSETKASLHFLPGSCWLLAIVITNMKFLCNVFPSRQSNSHSKRDLTWQNEMKQGLLRVWAQGQYSKSPQGRLLLLKCLITCYMWKYLYHSAGIFPEISFSTLVPKASNLFRGQIFFSTLHIMERSWGIIFKLAVDS